MVEDALTSAAISKVSATPTGMADVYLLWDGPDHVSPRLGLVDRICGRTK
jgi:hypothetical protein